MCWARGIGWSTRRDWIRQGRPFRELAGRGDTNYAFRAERASPRCSCSPPSAICTDHRRRADTQWLPDLPRARHAGDGQRRHRRKPVRPQPGGRRPQGRRPAHLHRTHPGRHADRYRPERTVGRSRPGGRRESDHLVPGEW